MEALMVTNRIWVFWYFWDR